MDVHLYVYDLSQGLARQLSQAFLGIYIDAVYHTSLVFGNIEYFFGAGIQTCLPGSTHHGQPMAMVPMGRTEIPKEIILEYLDSSKEFYTAESYDLFLHNCNNFTDDFSMFLVGKNIPDHITSLPATVMNTPFGQILKPQLDRAFRSVTQTPVVPLSASPGDNMPRVRTPPPGPSRLREMSVESSPNTTQVTSLKDLEKILEGASKSCAAIFFKRSNCIPCRSCESPYDLLASENEGKGKFLVVNVDETPDIAKQYLIYRTPAFATYVLGKKFHEWTGADHTELKTQINRIIELSNPAHPHAKIQLPTLQRVQKFVAYPNVPPLDWLSAMVSPDDRESAPFRALKTFVENLQTSKSSAPVTLPDLASISSFIRSELEFGEKTTLYPMIDLLRLALMDARVSSFFAGETKSTSLIMSLISHGKTELTTPATNTSNLFLLTIVQAICCMFTSPVTLVVLLTDETVVGPLIEFISDALISLPIPDGPLLRIEDSPEGLRKSKLGIRNGTASLAFNICAAVHNQRQGLAETYGSHHLGEEVLILPHDYRFDLAACLIEAIEVELNIREGTKREGSMLSWSSTKGKIRADVRMMGGNPGKETEAGWGPTATDNVDVAKTADPISDEHAAFVKEANREYLHLLLRAIGCLAYMEVGTELSDFFITMDAANFVARAKNFEGVEELAAEVEQVLTG